jgi:hypothetical protein
MLSTMLEGQRNRQIATTIASLKVCLPETPPCLHKMRSKVSGREPASGCSRGVPYALRLFAMRWTEPVWSQDASPPRAG